MITAGTTSIFNSTSPVAVAKVSATGGKPSGVIYPIVGRVYGFELYSGIGGTLVAKMDPQSRTPGDASWSDGLTTPNTWTVTSPAEITDMDYRFHGELAELPQRWDSTGTDVFVPVTASGIGRRLTQGADSLESVLFRALSGEDYLMYLPLEDPTGSISFSNAYAGGRTGILRDCSLGSDNTFPASKSVVRINSTASRIIGYAQRVPRGTYSWILFHWKFGSLPGTDVQIMQWDNVNGSVKRITVQADDTSYLITAFDADGATLGTSSVSYGADTDPLLWNVMQVKITDTGAGYNIDNQWYSISNTAESLTVYGSTITVASGTVGVPELFAVGGPTLLTDASYGHILMGVTDFNIQSVTYRRATNAYIGETAAARALRVTMEEGERCYCTGDPANSATMGAQPVDTLVNILQECVEVDRGVLTEARDQLGFWFRTYVSLHLQSGPELDYAAGELSGTLDPIDDDQGVVNDVTVTRSLGGFARVTKDSGPNNVNSPSDDPEGIGRYKSSVTRNVETDSDARSAAGQEVYIGTWDEIRYANVEAWLERSNFVGSAANEEHGHAFAALDVGDRLDLVNLPAWLPPDDVPLLVRGYTERLMNKGRRIKWNTTPYGPYLYVNWLLPAQDDVNKRRVAAISSYTVAAITDSASSMMITTSREAKGIVDDLVRAYLKVRV